MFITGQSLFRKTYAQAKNGKFYTYVYFYLFL